MAFYIRYPSAGGASSNPSVGTNGATAPTSSTEIGFIDGSGNLEGVSAANPLPAVITGTVPLPTGAATAALQTTQETTLAAIQANQTNGTQVTQITGALPLPTGGATAALQSNVQSAPGTPQTVALTVQGNASGVAVPISAAALPLPTGAATAANQATEIADLASIVTNTTGLATQTTLAAIDTNQTNGTQTSRVTDGTNTAAVKAASTAPLATDPALVVAVSPNSPAPKGTAGRSLANAPTVTTYGTPITSAAYTTIIASTTSATNLVEIFDSSGVALYFATGAAASEVNQFVIYPGGNGQVPLTIPAGTRISYKAVSTSASGASAFNVLNLYT